jgi:hypothetical protein
MTMDEQIREFARRFGNVDWNNGNCYYFASLLNARYGGGLYYDTIAGHFVCRIYGKYYDCDGEYTPIKSECVIKWTRFKQYDELQYIRIVNGCIL